MSDCVYRVVLDGRERECVAKNPGHITHVYLRTQGRARFEFVDLANGVEADVVPAPGASAPVPGAGTTTGSVVAAGSDIPLVAPPPGRGSSVGAGRDARTRRTPSVRLPRAPATGIPPST
jgi:hypothetical protein